MTRTRTAVTSVRCSAARLSSTWRIHVWAPIAIGSERTRNGVPARRDGPNVDLPGLRGVEAARDRQVIDQLARDEPIGAPGRLDHDRRGPRARPAGLRPSNRALVAQQEAEGVRPVHVQLVLDLARPVGQPLLAVGHERAVDRGVEQEAERDEGGERRSATPHGKAPPRPPEERRISAGARGPQAHRSYAAAMR